jgi:hypothetical protein
LSVPLRREAIRRWFRVVARYGSAGGEEVFFNPDPITKLIDATVRATRTRELFIFGQRRGLGFSRHVRPVL